MKDYEKMSKEITKAIPTNRWDEYCALTRELWINESEVNTWEETYRISKMTAKIMGLVK